MNIIAGKQYVTACGLITPPLKKLAGFEEMFDVGFGNPLLWKKNGIYIGRHDDPMLNIVKEHFQPFQCTYMSGDRVRYFRRIDEECWITVENIRDEWETNIFVRGPGNIRWSDMTIPGDFREELAEIKKEELDAWYERTTRAGKNGDHEQHSEPAGAGDVAG